MKKHIKLGLLAIFVGSVLMGCAYSSSNGDKGSQEKVFTFTKDQTVTQTYAVGETFLLEAESNPSTGYRWVIMNRKEASACIQFLKEQVFPAPLEVGRVGAPGKQQWQFKVKCAGKVRLDFEYRRPWETGVSTAAKSTVELNLVSKTPR